MGTGIHNSKLEYGHVVAGEYNDFVSGYPPLIVAKEPCKITYAKEIDYLARRTVLGYNDTHVFIATVDSPGLRFAQVQQLLTLLNVSYAINLDGGGSTRMLVEGKRVTEDLWSRPVDNVVAFYLQEPAPILYRVQVGAYSKKTNADVMQQRIIELEDTIGAGYRNAYVRYLDPYFKVQVGAFSVRSNAERVIADLKSRNIDSFITTK